MASLDLKELTTLRPRREWHDDDGDVLWWTAPVTEAPYCGTPFDSAWPGYHRYWSPLPNVVCAIRKKHISPIESGTDGK